jgi:TetR/AcrR family transcriptional repressor of nem operon
VQDLCESTNLSRSSLYDTFGDKRELFLASLDRFTKRQEQMVQEMLDHEGSRRERIEALFNWVLSDYRNEAGGGCLVVAAAAEIAGRDPDVQKRLTGNYDAFCETLATAIREGQCSGEFAQGQDPAALAGVLVNTIFGLRLTGLAGASRPQREQVVAQVMRLLG